MKLIACPECKRQWDVSRYRVGQRLRCTCNHLMVVPRLRSYTPDVHHCESCGGPRAPASIEPCQYCSAVPTRDAANLSLVCPFCMRRTAKKSRFCSSCGESIQPGALNVKTGKLICPRCSKTRLFNRKVVQFMVDECPFCSGMWVDAKAFDRIINQQAKRQDNEFRHGGANGQPIRNKLQPEQVKYLKCPDCQRHMHRRNFARASGVIVDECKDHGVWLDCDELGKIAAFVASGGLSYARRLKEKDDQATKATDYAPIPAFSQFPPLNRPTRVEETPLGSVLEIIRGLLG